MPKRNYEKKLREEQEATAHVFQEFIQTFQDVPSSGKTFVKSGILYDNKSLLASNETTLYNPVPIVKNSITMQNALECAKIVKDLNFTNLKKKKFKVKSNLELLKEELKQRHSDKHEKSLHKQEITAVPALSYFDGGDPNSTNLFVANLNINITESHLIEEFGEFGPLASVKIMWPRGDDRFKNMNTNCGFVAFMSRRDAERALNNMRNRSDMRVGWGKSVELPVHPVYIPEKLLKLCQPPPQSGLPFNVQINWKYRNSNVDLDKLLFDSVVKVTIPLNKRVLFLTHRMVEYVIKEGPLFEAIIMNNEIGNFEYEFLFDNKSPDHVYYRWKLFSILQGAGTRQWKMDPFRMFEGGSIWLPPVAPDYQKGMPEELFSVTTENSLLSDNQCGRLTELIRNLNVSRNSVAEVMAFCLNHASAINDSLDLIADSLLNPSTIAKSKIARFYLLSDVLSNCIRRNLKFNKNRIPMDSIMKELQSCFENISDVCEKFKFQTKVLRVLLQMELIHFLTEETAILYKKYFETNHNEVNDDNSSDDGPLDGPRLLKISQKNKIEDVIIAKNTKIEEDSQIKQEFFAPSKWDKLDPEDLEAQSMSSIKLYYMDMKNEISNSSTNEEYDKKVESRKRKSEKENTNRSYRKKKYKKR
ncbi:hypothetical protein ABEB36_003554 [Hypothenemus hampei]|uniref:Uncharacterized protein n=1 Tax=Hypothenemus hampei TaxID=57062 RepID=A0ABD1F9J2_HYPHA